MSAATAYLAQLAADLGDRELPTIFQPRKGFPAHVHEELLYAAQLFQRAERAITAEIVALEAAGVVLDPIATMRVSSHLAALSAQAQIAAITGRVL